VGIKFPFYRLSGESPSTILKDDGTVWTWECNLRAACDMLSALRSNNPVQIQGLTDIVKLGQGFSYDHIALKKDGTVWIWGAGYLSNPKFDGSGKEDPPSQINGLSDIVDISVGGNHILALKKDGTVWSMGYFPRDYKFLSNTIALENYRPLAQVEGLTDVTAVFSGDQTDAVIKKDGSLWLWGYDSQGLFGSDNMTLQLSPVQVELKPSPEIPRR
jgi:alpha-tubulin suppressor-like RCC1 family protein